MQIKFGINNIFTTFWFFAMLLSSGTLTYLSIVNNVFSSDLFFVGKCVMGFIILLFTGIVLYVLYKFRIVFIDDTSITSINPFLESKQKIDVSKIKKIEINNFYAFHAAMCKNVKMTHSYGTVEISDLEFENFEKLVCYLNIDQNKKN